MRFLLNLNFIINYNKIIDSPREPMISLSITDDIGKIFKYNVSKQCFQTFSIYTEPLVEAEHNSVQHGHLKTKNTLRLAQEVPTKIMSSSRSKLMAESLRELEGKIFKYNVSK